MTIMHYTQQTNTSVFTNTKFSSIRFSFDIEIGPVSLRNW